MQRLTLVGVLIADGKNVWFYDRCDLEQVTVKSADAALSATPMMLLTGGAEGAGKAFDISDAGTKGIGLQRGCGSSLRAAESRFQRQAVLGFAEGELKQMILEDKLGQQATLNFTRSQRNAPVTDAEVSFTPPKGVDVIGKPQ